ncbi:16S rRNA (guanine(966)-N(2))-methyltransferase RsmD [Virgibacillus alimentarius]|uniref:16S rRNA (Guanine966-N2)-methyltransferase n=1 Tax=Virgibacillus alimentarius TaxID=698769 RepID=A0ABS4S3N2_9BACI|nr:16S rRNA (guanine966-N2)-methyltransferase [Virgibacillus alimentarius]
MRVIAGELKGRQMKSVPGKTTRPTTDKVKEAVFQMIGPYFSGGTCLDLFAGSGALGIEALSRGIEQIVFVDKQSSAVHTIYENLKLLKIENKAEVFRTDAFRAIQAAAKRKLQFDLIFLDPPYKKMNYESLIHQIMQLDLLAENGMMYCEHHPSEKIPLHHEHLNVIKQANYGSTIGITIFKHI